MSKKYLIIVEDAGSNFSAFSPDVADCVATGNSIEETVNEMRSALEFHLEDDEIWPEPKGIKKYMDDDSFKKNPKDYILQIEVGW